MPLNIGKVAWPHLNKKHKNQNYTNNIFQAGWQNSKKSDNLFLKSPWGNRHFNKLVVGIPNEKTHVEGNLAVSSKISCTFNLLIGNPISRNLSGWCNGKTATKRQPHKSAAEILDRQKLGDYPNVHQQEGDWTNYGTSTLWKYQAAQSRNQCISIHCYQMISRIYYCLKMAMWTKVFLACYAIIHLRSGWHTDTWLFAFIFEMKGKTNKTIMVIVDRM